MICNARAGKEGEGGRGRGRKKDLEGGFFYFINECLHIYDNQFEYILFSTSWRNCSVASLWLPSALESECGRDQFLWLIGRILSWSIMISKPQLRDLILRFVINQGFWWCPDLWGIARARARARARALPASYFFKIFTHFEIQETFWISRSGFC